MFVLGIGLDIRTKETSDEIDNNQLQGKVNVHEHSISELKGS